jgi:hypothetical protein
MEHPECKTCPYWEPDENTDAGNGCGPEEGFCHRHAPQPLLNIRPGKDQERHGYVFIPSATDSSYWCGDHPDFPVYIRGLRRKTASTAEVICG